MRKMSYSKGPQTSQTHLRLATCRHQCAPRAWNFIRQKALTNRKIRKRTIFPVRLPCLLCKEDTSLDTISSKCITVHFPADILLINPTALIACGCLNHDCQIPWCSLRVKHRAWFVLPVYRYIAFPWIYAIRSHLNHSILFLSRSTA